jgi:4-diphosphocytidyl-2-C-methyl-D-erythritol kinase
MTGTAAHAKINLTLVVGGARPDGLHEIATVMQRIELADTVSLEPAGELTVEGFAADTLVRRALTELAAAAGVEPAWRARIEKRIPVAAGLGGGSSDAATALRLACELLAEAPEPERLRVLAARLGADVPFFLEPGPALATGEGTVLERLELRQDYTVLLLLPRGAAKSSTAEVYGRFTGAAGFEARRARVLELVGAGSSAELAAFPPNDLVSSPVADRLRALGAFRADVTGAGPTVYGLFAERAGAEAAREALAGLGESWLTAPAW